MQLPFMQFQGPVEGMVDFCLFILFHVLDGRTVWETEARSVRERSMEVSKRGECIMNYTTQNY